MNALTVAILILICTIAAIVVIKYFGTHTTATALTGGASSHSSSVISAPQVLLMTNNILRTTPITSFLWAEKTDGLRKQLHFENGTTIDVERLNNGKTYVFDVCNIAGKDVSEIGFAARYEQLLSKEFDLLKSNKILAKTYTKCENDKKTFDQLYSVVNSVVSPSTGANIDGIIFQRIDAPYKTGGAYKMKRKVMNTIDFLLKYVAEKGYFLLYLYGTYVDVLYNLQPLPKTNPYQERHTGVVVNGNTKLPSKLLVLFSSPFFNNLHYFEPNEHWSRKDYKKEDIITINALMSKIAAKPIDYDGKIIEMSLSSNGWVPYRERNDKEHPNGYFVGDSTMDVLFSPVNFEQNHYFENVQHNKELNSLFHRVNKEIRKRMVAKLLTAFPTKKILDVAGGRGGDSEYFIENGVRTIYAIDSDREALVSYKKRLSKLHLKDLTFYARAFALSDNNQNFPHDGAPFNVAIMNYAIHYLCDNEKNIIELRRTLSSVLSDNGVFMFSFYDGDKLMQDMVDGIVKLNSFTIEIDTKRNVAKMPLPTIDKSGYREEPLVMLSMLSNLQMGIIEDYYPAREWYEQLKIIDPIEQILDLSKYIRVIVCRISK